LRNNNEVGATDGEAEDNAINGDWKRRYNGKKEWLNDMNEWWYDLDQID